MFYNNMHLSTVLSSISSTSLAGVDIIVLLGSMMQPVKSKVLINGPFFLILIQAVSNECYND